MNRKQLKSLIKKTLKESQTLNEAENCGFVDCKCPDGTKYRCKDMLATEPKCDCCSDANCIVAKDLLGGGKVAGSGSGKGIKLSKIRGKVKKSNKKMKKENITERFQQLAGIKSLHENEEVTGEISGEKMKEFLMKEDGDLNEGIFTAIGGLIAILSAAGVTTAIEMALEDPAIAEKYPKLTDLFGTLKTIGNSSLTKGIKENKKRR